MKFTRSFLIPLAVILWGLQFQAFAQSRTQVTSPVGYASEIEEEPGFSRCDAVELDAALRQQFPDMLDAEAFEVWMSRAQRQVTPMRSVVTLPVIVHILHDGSSVGSGYNLSTARVQSQIDVLNKDFRRLNADTASTPTQYLGIASDLNVEFRLATRGPDGLPLKEPGINRIDKVAMGWSAGMVTPTYVNNNIKPSTQWDPELYINIWVVPLANNKLGAAQFPQQSGLLGLNYNDPASTDGLIITTNAFGENPANTPYSKGRTTTHEMGHFFGLRHIWGDGGCGVDDHCADTPEADQGHYGCQAGVQSCGSRDMVENFMDYSDDACMNLFTADQKARVQTVLQLSPRRVSLVTSDRADPLGPEVYVNSGELDVAEENASGSGCDEYQDIYINLELAAATITGGSIELQIQSATATQGVDYSFPGGNIATFTPGQSAAETVVLRIHDDGTLEGEETLELKLDLVSGGASDLMILTDHDSLLVRFADDERDPTVSLRDTLVWENFENVSAGSLPAGWSMYNSGSGGNNTWVINSTSALDGNQSAHISDGTGGYKYDKSSSSQSYLVTPLIQGSDIGGLELSFDYKVEGELFSGTVYDYGQIFISWNGASFFPLTDRLYQKAGSTFHMELVLPDSLKDQQFYLAFGWVNDYIDGFDPPFMVDNVAIVEGALEVATELNATSTQALGPYETVHFFDDSTGNLICTIENLGSHDYGCTSVEIDRSGLGAEAFLDAGSPETGLMARTLRVLPTHAQPGDSGNYRITLYYTAEEVESFETATGQFFEDCQMVKTPAAISDIDPSAALLPNGIISRGASYADTLRYAYAFTAEFDSPPAGFGIGQPGSSYRNAFPIDYITFDVWEEATHAKMSWEFETDNGVTHFEVERSVDGRAFQPIAELSPSQLEKYGLFTFTDSNVVNFRGQQLFYRVKGIDVDGGEYLTEVKSLTVLSGTLAMHAYPNPVASVLNVEIEQSQWEGDVEIALLDLTGRKIYQNNLMLRRGTHLTQLDLSGYSSGVYLLQIADGNGVVQQRIIRE